MKLSARAVDPFAKEKQTAVYMRYVREQQGGYAGSFNEYIAERGLEGEVLPIVDRGEIDAAEQFASAVAAEDSGDEGDEGDGGDGGGLDLDEEIVEKISENGPFMDATYESMLANSPWTTMLGAEPEDPHALVGVEILLGTLEALHIDNARIEISGGNEVRFACSFRRSRHRRPKSASPPSLGRCKCDQSGAGACRSLRWMAQRSLGSSTSRLREFAPRCARAPRRRTACASSPGSRACAHTLPRRSAASPVYVPRGCRHTLSCALARTQPAHVRRVLTCYCDVPVHARRWAHAAR